jgi:SAM-dependent methyltransferase
MAGASKLEEVACLLCGSAGGDVVAVSEEQQHTSREPFRFVECSGCGLVRLSPRVPARMIGPYYDSTYLAHRGASAWGRYAPIVERAMAGTDRARVRRVMRAQPLTQASRVLDVGCGRPTYLRALHATVGAQCVGVDFADDLWRGDPERWQGLELHKGELKTVPLKPGFDVITLWHALEHEYDPLETLRHLRRLAAPGARLVVEVPNYDSLIRRWHGNHWAGFHTSRHTVAFTPRTLAGLLERAGWKVEQQLRYGTLDPYISWWLGQQERRGLSVRGDLSGRFVPYVLGKLALLPMSLLQRWVSFGAQTAIARV